MAAGSQGRSAQRRGAEKGEKDGHRMNQGGLPSERSASA
jgi:hypothetical protein